MYIYHNDNNFKEILFKNNTIDLLIKDLNTALVNCGVHTEYGKDGDIHTTAQKFRSTCVRVPSGVAAETIFFHRHDCSMTSVGQRISTDMVDFWKYVEKYSLLSIFEKYIPKINLQEYIEFIKLPTLDDVVHLIGNKLGYHYTSQYSQVKFAIKRNEKHSDDSEVNKIYAMITEMYPNGVMFKDGEVKCLIVE